jgi:hypothetical protein
VRTSSPLRSSARSSVASRALPAPDARLRACPVGSQVVGLLLARYVIGLAPLSKADHDAFAAAVLPTLQRYLTGELR